jgi:hypothetical protein
MLLFHTSALAPKTTRATQGVSVMTLKSKYKLAEIKPAQQTAVVNPARYRVRSLPAAGSLLPGRRPGGASDGDWTRAGGIGPATGRIS